MNFPNKTSAKIIPFPAKGAFASEQKWGKRHFSYGKEFSSQQVGAFISALIQNNIQDVKKLLKDHGNQLATLHSNYFCLPLLIAANHRNIAMVNLLLENGACLYSARHDARFNYINPKMKSYLKSMMRLRQYIWDSI